MPPVFLLIDWFLPAYKAGGPVQSLANLVAQDGGVHYQIICSNQDVDGSPVAVPGDQWTTFNSSTNVWYSTKGTNRELLSLKGLLFINGIYSWQYNLKPILLSTTSRKIVSARGMLHPGALSQKPLKKKLYLFFWKLLGLHRQVEFHASNEEEKRFIQAVFGTKIRVHVAANFPRIFQKQKVGDKARGFLHLVSVALLSPMKNILSVLKALVEVKSNIIYHIYGPIKEEGYWQQCQEVIKKLPANVTVHYHGDVHPQKVEEALEKGHVFILPSKSENFGHAIFEALSAGKPVITSHGTPWNGLEEAKAGVNVNPDKGEEVANAISYFADMEKAELEEWSQGAKRYSEKAINLEEIKQQYRRMFGVADQQTTHDSR